VPVPAYVHVPMPVYVPVCGLRTSFFILLQSLDLEIGLLSILILLQLLILIVWSDDMHIVSSDHTINIINKVDIVAWG
jgi:hypothetical protein